MSEGTPLKRNIGVLGISGGGTGATIKQEAFDALAPTRAAGDLICHDGRANIRLPNGSSGQILTIPSDSGVPRWSSPPAPATPGGSDTQVQFNDGGTFGGDSGLTYNKTTKGVSTAGDISIATGKHFCINGTPLSASDVGALANVVEDLTPQLGGELDCQAHAVGFTQQGLSSSGGACAVDWRLGNKASITLTENVTFTFTAPSNPCNLLIKLVQDGTGGRAVVWPASVKWAGGQIPTLSSAGSSVDICSFYYDGTNYYGVASLNFS